MSFQGSSGVWSLVANGCGARPTETCRPTSHDEGQIMKAGQKREPGPIGDSLVVAAAVLASIAAIRLITGSTAVTVAYAGGLAVLGLVAYAAGRRRATPAPTSESAPPDWSVTVAAIEQPGVAIAITDRANR